MAHSSASIAERVDTTTFWAAVCIRGNDECWEWTRAKDRKGYGRMQRRGIGLIGAHRVALILSGADVPDGAFVCHACDNPSCCNPAHLFVGNASDNMRDAVSKGRHFQSAKQTCPQGHLYDAVRTRARGPERICTICERARKHNARPIPADEVAR